ncbi:response regulator [Marinoscillum sp. 108]|jgi:CheY-like chemotaxis protein|uniref:Response regulator n=1 Tax=Marinoscillum luteum TaxID=861051 RepID=A0ABW7N4Z0_9BACT|nr:response regulator [Marinoscillum sp. 108]VXD10344.1 CheY chemotaxis protein or a CheY-like REC (Receiver) domain [Marinoscillum sp. 108]
MKPKIDCILLVDDDEDCNFFHERLIKKMECADRVEASLTGNDALDFLRSSVNGQHPRPNLILLDINMPGMDGWGFLEEYNKLSEDQKAQIVVVMLTTSLNPDDRVKAESDPNVGAFANKYLDEESLLEILKANFPHFR